MQQRMKPNACYNIMDLEIKVSSRLSRLANASLARVDEASCSPTYTTVAMASSCNDSVMRSQELTIEDKRYAEEILNEIDETRENAVVEIRSWVEDEVHIRIDDFLILRFLRVCKFNLEKTKTRIRNYYKQRSRLSDWYMNKDPFRPELQELLDIGVILPLLKPDRQGRLVIITRSTLYDPKRNKMSDLSKLFIMVTEVAMKYYPAASVYGCAVLGDIVNPSIDLILQLRPHILMNWAHLLQSCYPMRYQMLVMFNTPILFDAVARIFRSFMTQKMKDRFHVYSNTVDCFKDIPPEILPVEYGGTGDTCQKLAEYWKKLIEENSDWLTHDDENDRIE